MNVLLINVFTIWIGIDLGVNLLNRGAITMGYIVIIRRANTNIKPQRYMAR